MPYSLRARHGRARFGRPRAAQAAASGLPAASAFDDQQRYRPGRRSAVPAQLCFARRPALRRRRRRRLQAVAGLATAAKRVAAKPRPRPAHRPPGPHAGATLCPPRECGGVAPAGASRCDSELSECVGGELVVTGACRAGRSRPGRRAREPGPDAADVVLRLANASRSMPAALRSASLRHAPRGRRDRACRLHSSSRATPLGCRRISDVAVHRIDRAHRGRGRRPHRDPWPRRHGQDRAHSRPEPSEVAAAIGVRMITANFRSVRR
jgi:hypothetical protein